MRDSSPVIVKPLFAGVFLALLGIMPTSAALSSDRTIVLEFFCESYESARQVALEQDWRSQKHMPDDCNFLVGEMFEKRIAKILQVLEVIQLRDGRWIEIGRVHQNASDTGYVTKNGYSAGKLDPLHLF